MKRRAFLTGLMAAPLAGIPVAAGATAMGGGLDTHRDALFPSARPTFDYGRAVHAPLSEAARVEMKAAGEEAWQAHKRIYAGVRMYDLFNRCNSAFTVASSFVGDGYVIDETFVKSMIPRINAGHAARMSECLSSEMLYACGLLGIDSARLAPLEVYAFQHGPVPRSESEYYHFRFHIPQHNEPGIHIASAVHDIRFS